jgi:hypothetical protein
VSEYFSPDFLGRREFLSLAAAGTVATAIAPEARSAASKPAGFIAKMDFKNRLWNRDAYARLQANLDTDTISAPC